MGSTIKTFPTVPDAWCETTLNPPEGGWSVVDPAGQATLSLSTSNVIVGARCVDLYAQVSTPWETLRFSLNNGYEFNGNAQQAKLLFYLQLEGGKFDGNVLITLRDASGRRAYRQFFGQVVGSAVYFELNMGPSGDFTVVDAGFDWSYIKYVDVGAFTATSWGAHLNGHVWVDEFHFSYYELVLGRLTILSDPPGKQFLLDGQAFVTDGQSHGLGIQPYVDYTVRMDSTDFKAWENGGTSPIRTVNLSEGESLTITAYYVTAPPPPGKGKLKVSSNVTANVSVRNTAFSGNTPFEANLDPGGYTVDATFDAQPTQSRDAAIVEGQTTLVDFEFVAAGGIDWGPVVAVVGIVVTLCSIGTAIYLKVIE